MIHRVTREFEFYVFGLCSGEERRGGESDWDWREREEVRRLDPCSYSRNYRAIGCRRCKSLKGSGLIDRRFSGGEVSGCRRQVESGNWGSVPENGGVGRTGCWRGGKRKERGETVYVSQWWSSSVSGCRGRSERGRCLWTYQKKTVDSFVNGKPWRYYIGIGLKGGRGWGMWSRFESQEVCVRSKRADRGMRSVRETLYVSRVWTDTFEMKK